MNVCITPSAPAGTIRAIASKSAAHRLLICAAFADRITELRCEEINEDIAATVRCLCALGANIERIGVTYRVTPIRQIVKGALLDCGESGSTLRFLLPIVCTLGADASFLMSGRLPQRPLSPLREELERCGIRLSEKGSNPLTVTGTLKVFDFSIPADVSSQFISGLLFAIARSGEQGSIRLLGKLESAPYVDMTVHALALFGLCVTREGNLLRLTENRGLRSPSALSVEGDWSGAAFPLCLGALGVHPITVTDLSPLSHQGDRAVVDLLRRFGAEVTEKDGTVTVSPARLHAIDIDASQIPDLVPVLAVVAACAEGTTVISGAARLRIKESDRLRAIRVTLNELGAEVIETSDGLIIHGKKRLIGGSVSSFGDHRIAMSAAVASVACQMPVTVENASVTAKSYPSFWQDMRSLGMEWAEIETKNN